MSFKTFLSALKPQAKDDTVTKKNLLIWLLHNLSVLIESAVGNNYLAEKIRPLLFWIGMDWYRKFVMAKCLAKYFLRILLYKNAEFIKNKFYPWIRNN